MEEVLGLGAQATCKSRGRELLGRMCRFLLSQLGYAYDGELHSVKRYRIVWGLLLSYTLVSLRALIYSDIQSVIINIIWTCQIFVSRWGEHKDYVSNQPKGVERMNESVPIGNNEGSSPWGTRILIYVVILFAYIVSIAYRLWKGDWSSFGEFSIAAFVIAFVDGACEIIIGLYGATVKE